MSSQFDREIEEILGKARLPKHPRRRLPLGWLTWVGHQVGRLFNPWAMGLTGAALFVAGLVLGSWPLVFGGIGLTLAAYFIHILRSGRSFRETTGFDRSWRGRSLDEQDRPGWFRKKPK